MHRKVTSRAVWMDASLVTANSLPHVTASLGHCNFYDGVEKLFLKLFVIIRLHFCYNLNDGERWGSFKFLCVEMFSFHARFHFLLEMWLVTVLLDLRFHFVWCVRRSHCMTVELSLQIIKVVYFVHICESYVRSDKHVCETFRMKSPLSLYSDQVNICRVAVLKISQPFHFWSQ